MYLSIIIPAYNEAKRIENTLCQLYEYFKEYSYEYEIIVVDDGSNDGTPFKAAVSKLAVQNRLRVIKNGKNTGKGYSVKNGIINSKGKYILLCDADLSVPISEIDKLFNSINEGYDIVIGSRSVKGSSVEIHQPWYRERMGKIFNFFIKCFILSEFNDTQCGFKLLRGDIAREIAPMLRIDGFCYDVELLYIAKRKGCRIKEVGVVWSNSPQSKVKVLGSSLNMFFDLFKIKKSHK